MKKNSDEPIELPSPAKLPKSAGRYRYFVPFLLLWLILATLAGWWIWAQFGDVNSSHAVVEGDVLAAIPSVSAPVSEIFVNENQDVAQGQPLARLEGGPQAYGGSNSGGAPAPYSPEDTYARAGEAKTREEAFVRRVAEARQEEAAAVRELENLSMAHVKAQLEVRSLEAMGVNVPRESYDRARQVELAARVRMEAARSAREEASRVRAAVETELGATRAEAKQMRAMQTQTGYAPPLPPPAADNPFFVLAPGPGRVVGVGAPGTMARRGYPLMTIIPPDGGGLWVMAYFREKPAASIKPGQRCSVLFEGSEQEAVDGTIMDVAAISGKGTDRQVPVRIQLDFTPNKSRPALNLGMKASVVVHTRPLPTSFIPQAWLSKLGVSL